MNSTTATPVLKDARLRAAGVLTVWAGLLGAAAALVIIAWPDEVPDSRYSYPFGPTSYVVAQLFFAVQHLGLLAGLYAVTRVVWSRATTASRVGLAVSLAGMVALSACELFALTATHAAVDSTDADAVNSSYGFPMVALGIGLVLAGRGIARGHLLSGAGRWIVLALGVYVFVPMFPAVFGPLLLGRIAIGGWMVLFAVLGREIRRAQVATVP